MEDLNDFITGDTLTAAQFIQPMSEVQNIIEDLSITLSVSDLNQLGKAIAGYVANGTFYTDSGIADAYVLTKIGLKQTATAYTDGFFVSFIAGNPGTGGAATVNVAGLGVKNIKLSGGGDPSTNSISGRVELVFDGPNDRFELLSSTIDRLNPATLAILVIDDRMEEGDIIRVQEHTLGFGGGAFWKAVLLTSVTPSVGEPLIGNIVVSDGVPTLAFVLQLKDSIVNVASVGALEDSGTTDNTAAFLIATSLNLSVFVPRVAAGAHYKGSIVMNDDQTLFSWNAEVRAGASNIGLTHGQRSTSDGLNFKGAGKAVGPGQVGVSALGKLGTRTRNLVIDAINGDGYQRNEGVDRHQGNHLVDFVIKDCVTGINEGTRGEYNKTSVGSIYGCDDGLIIRGGNNNYSNVTVTDNTNGAHLVAGANDAHGVCSGLTLNHNTKNIFVDNTTVPSFRFSGCQIFAGDIHLLNSNGVTFSGCDISIVEIQEENARFCQFAACHFISQITVSPNFNSTSSEVYYHNSNIYNDTTMTRPVFFPEGSRSKATLENNTLAIATGTTTNILDTNTENTISGNPNFAFTNFFQDGGGLKNFDFSLKTRIDSDLIFFNATVNVGRLVSYLAVNDVTVRLQGAVLGTMLTATFQRQSDDTVRFTNVYTLSGYVRRDNNDLYKLELVNNSGGNVDVFRDQSGDFICFCEAFGW